MRKWRLKIALLWSKIKFLWYAINTDDDEVKQQLFVAESNIRKSIAIKERLKKLDPKDKEAYDELKNMKISESMREGLLQASRTVRKWDREEKERRALFDKQELVDMMTKVFNDYIDSRIDLAVKIRERHQDLDKAYEIKRELEQAFKTPYVE